MKASLPKETAEGRVIVRSLLDRKHDAVVARGRFGPIFSAYLQHATRWEALPDIKAQTMMRHGLAAATLNLAVRPRDEFTAWTLNIKRPPMNFFFTGDNTDFIIVGRVYTSGVMTTESSRLFMESQRPKREPSRSSLDVEGMNVLKIFEQFFDRSEQMVSRLFELGRDAFVLIQGLPQADAVWLRSLDTAGARGYLKRKLELVDERSYRFLCGCNPGKILRVLCSIHAGKADELFGKEHQVEVYCPRCGRRYWISREDFQLGPEKVGVS